MKDMSLETICLPVKAELEMVEKELINSSRSNVALVQDATAYVLKNGGKRIRPALLLLASKMLGADMARAVRLAVAIEMVHAASLMHDDVLDNATLRRGKASANVKWGNQISILVGDFLWCRASELAIKYGNDKIMTSVIDAVSGTTQGEILEITRSNDFTLNKTDYLEIIRLKTAMLFQSACQIGSLLSNSGNKFEEAMRSYGLNLGIAFQLADDVLDYVATDEKFGKKTGTDLCEGRLTLPLILTLQKASEEEANIIKSAVIASVSESSTLERINNILSKHNSIEISLREASEYADTAKNALEPFKPSLLKDALMALAGYSVLRSE